MAPSIPSTAQARSAPWRGRPPWRDRALPLLLAAGVVGLVIAERSKPRRIQTQSEPGRSLRNLAMGAMSMAVVAALEAPVAQRLATRSETGRRGLVQHLPVPDWMADALAVLAMDYTIYVWHVLTHKVPVLWRFHLVHHIDLDLDASTALRFHAADMLISLPYRAAQIALIGTSRRAWRLWQGFFFASILFHHANLRLPAGFERRLAWVLTTPRMHGIHHTARRVDTDANWSSGLSFWDRLHGTFRWEASGTAIGVAAYRDPSETRLRPSLILPFRRRLRDAWTTADGGGPQAPAAHVAPPKTQNREQ